MISTKNKVKKVFLPKDDFRDKLCYNGGNDFPEVRPMFRNLFHPDSNLMITMTWITDCIFLSLFWVLGCLPLVTFGGVSAALYDAVFRAFRRGDKHSWGRFAKVFRENWKQGILPGILYLAVFFSLARCLIGLWNAAVYGEISWMVFSGVAFLAVALLGVMNVMMPMLSRFDNSLGALLRNTVLVSLVNLPGTLAVGMVNAVAVVLSARFVFPVFFLPAVAALISSLFIEPMFGPYMKDDDTEPCEDAAQ